MTRWQTANDLIVHNTASGAYSLKVMTVVVIFLPVVLAYQTWTYYVFRRHVSRHEFQPSPRWGARPDALNPTSANPDGAAPPAGPGN